MRGQHAILDIPSGSNNSVYIDRAYLQNPGHSVPLLAANFGLYEQYFVHNMELEYVPAVAVTEAGTVHIAPDYDPTDLFPASANAMSSAKGYVSGPVSLGLRCKMPNYRALDNSYVRPMLYTSPACSDRLCSYGSFRVISTGTTTIVGRVILHYDISFSILEPQQVSVGTTGVDKITLPVAEAHPLIADGTSHEGNNMPYFLNDSAARLAVDANKIISAIIGDTSTAKLECKGREVLPGTRIFMRPCNKLEYDTTGVTKLVEISSNLGAWNLSRTFDALTNIAYSGVVDSFVKLLDPITLF